MEMNFHAFHSTEKRTMMFLGKVKLERWSCLLRLVDDLTHFVVSQAIGEGSFKYSTTWRTNKNIIGFFIGVLVQAKVVHREILNLCLDIFNPFWRKGLEKAVYNIDEKG